jgi:TonB-dependent starch-binding outer membrane protein SusC
MLPIGNCQLQTVNCQLKKIHPGWSRDVHSVSNNWCNYLKHIKTMKFLFPAKGLMCSFLSAYTSKYKGWIMKLSCLTIAVCVAGLQLLMANTGEAQGLSEIKITLELKSEPLKTAFTKIEKQTDFRFAYNKKQVDLYKNITLAKDNYILEKLLDILLANTQLSYKQVNNKIIIFQTDKKETDNTKTALNAETITPADGSIKGKITNEKGEPVAGASILLVGQDKGTAANAQGDFTITGVKPGKYKLQISAVGFQNVVKEITVSDGQSTEISFQLKPGSNALDEVIVTGYSKQSKRDVTGAITTISANTVAQTPVSDVGSVLEGHVAGVSVDAQGGPGSTAVVRIRGFGTNGNNDPLYVIDGVQMRGGNNLVNPGDIETLTILKDPSITSLYGAEGGNGVIVITTKSGKIGTPRLEYSSYASWESPIKYPSMLSPQQYANTYWGYLKNSGLAQSDPYYGSGSSPVLPDYIIERQSGAQLAVSANDPAASPDLYNLSSYRILKTNKQGTDWFKAVLGKAFSQSHQLSVSGATDKSNYALSLNYLDNKGILLGTFFRRYSLRVNTEFKPAKWMKIGENIQFSFSQGNSVDNHNPQGLFADLYQRSPLIPVYDIEGNYSGPKGITNSLALNPGGNNPVFGQQNGLKNNKGYNSGIIGSGYLDVEPIKGLVVETKIGLQFYNNSYRYFTDTIPQNVFTAPYNSFAEGGGWTSDWRWTNKISYDIRINQIHKISAFVAYEAREYFTRSYGGATPNLPYTIPSYLNLSNGAPVDTTGGIFNTVNGSSDAETENSVFGNINYSLMDKYLFSYVIRRDGSSKFGPLRKYGTFPSYSVGWRVSQEKFMNNVNWVNDLKLRAALGSNGNNAIPSGLYENQYNTNPYVSSYDLGGTNNSAVTGVGLYQIGNPYIHWETNQTTNIGFDAALFKNRLSVAFSWFNRVTKDLLAVPPLTGLQGDALAPYENIMKFSNKGVELELGYNNNIGKLRYEMSFNIATYRNKVLYIDGDTAAHLDGDSYAPTHFSLTRSVVGRPVSSFYGLVEDGIFQSGDDYTKYGVTEPGLTAANAAGHFKFKDINKDGKIDDNDRTFIGSPHPKFSYGYTLNLFYMNFDLGIFLQGVSGNKIFNYWRVNSEFPGALGAGSADTWSTTNTNAKLPVWASGTNDDKNPSSFFVESGSYMRIKSLQLGYTFPKSKAFSRLRVYVQGYNLITFTKYTGIDPEVSTGSATNAGVDFGGNYPIARKVLVGLNFGL